MRLTELEKEVLQAIIDNADDIGGSFAIGNEIHYYTNISRQKLGGIIGSLAKKGYVKVSGAVAGVDSQISIIKKEKL